MRKIIMLAMLLSVALSANGAYTEVECSTDAVFGENTCDQCFNGWELKKGDNISFLDDIWNNDTSNKKIMYKEEQKLPELKVLNGANIAKKPNDDTFWEYTPEFEALKNAEFDGYVLPAWEKVSWIKSSMWAAYRVEESPQEGQNAWIMVYEVMSHNILESGEISMSEKAHKECVLYKAWAWEVETPVIEEVPTSTEAPAPKAEEMTKVKTWPEMYILVLMVSFVLGIAFTRRQTILAFLRK